MTADQLARVCCVSLIVLVASAVFVELSLAIKAGKPTTLSDLRTTGKTERVTCKLFVNHVTWRKQVQRISCRPKPTR